MEQFGEQFLKAERYLFLSFKNARKRARKIGTFSAQKWAKLRRNNKKPAKFAGFCSWYLNTTGYMVDDNGLEPLTLRTSTFMLKRSRLVCAAEDPRRGSHRPPHQRSEPALQPITQSANSTFHCINIRVRIPSSSLNVRMS